MELAGNLRPEFPGHIEGHVGADADPGPFRYGAKSPLVIRMIHIAQSLGAGGSEPFRVIGHKVAGITVRDEGVAQRISEPLIEGAMPHAVIARILMEN